MIGKTTLSSSFESTLRYVYGKENATVICSTVASCHDPMQVAEAMTKVAGGRSKKPCYHISLSPSEGDCLEAEDWYRLSEDFLEELGISSHQSVVVLHDDATYPSGETRPHIHFVINRYELGTIADRALCLHFPRIERVIRNLEQKYHLEAIPCSWEVQRRGDSAPQHHRCQRESTPSIRSQMQDTVDQELRQADSFESLLEELKSRQVVPHLTNKGIRFEKDGISFAGYQLGQSYTRHRLEQVLVMDDERLPAGLSMAQVMQQALETPDAASDASKTEALSPPPSRPRSTSDQRSNLLTNTGIGLERLGHDVGGNSQEIDGMMLADSSMRLGSSIAILADLFFKRLEEARQKAQSEQAEALIEELERVGDRTSALESKLQRQNSQESLSVRATQTNIESSDELTGELTRLSQDSSQEAGSREPDPLKDSFVITGNRLNQLEQSLGINSSEYPPLKFNLDAPIEVQLDQMESAIHQLNERLETLEASVEKETTVAQKPEPETIAQTLANYVQVRAQYYSIPPTESVPTRTLGTIELSYSGDEEVIAVIDPSYGAKFEAVKMGETWEVVSNDLSEQESQVMVGLPQTVEGYESVTQSKELIRYFQQKAPQEFEGDRGKIAWKDRQGKFNYNIDIATGQDGSKTVIGRDQRTEQVVMQAQLRSDGGIQIEKAQVPKEHAQSLLQTQITEPDPTEERFRSVQKRKHRTPDRELTL